ncbi:neuroglian-like [Littorina saxatilis]|uniref:neuroglian-like n=1 Tax=Littorina saxatilis TaxID=31220 RepID=UPI0038B64EE8
MELIRISTLISNATNSLFFSFCVSLEEQLCLEMMRAMKAKAWKLRARSGQWRCEVMSMIVVQGEKRARSGQWRCEVMSMIVVQGEKRARSGQWRCEVMSMIVAQGEKRARSGFIHIEGKPPDQDVVEGSRTRIVCKTSSDPLDSSQLHIRWLINGRLLNMSAAPDNKYVQKSDKSRHALIIKNAQLEDSGEYTCIASLGLDSDRATALLTVKSRPGAPLDLEIRSVHGNREELVRLCRPGAPLDLEIRSVHGNREELVRLCRPGAPLDLEIRSVHGNRAELVWQAGPDHGAKVTHYLLQFNTSDAPDVWYDYYETIPGEKLHYFVDLPPWGTYTFRLLANNELGLGEPSKPTAQSCTTPPDRPDRNPKNVVTLTHKKLYLIVEWTPMHRLEFHGPGFKYHVYWRRKGSLTWEDDVVDDPAKGHFEREVNDVYQVYEIQVKAENDLGEAHQPPFTYQGRSGEAEPLVVPRDFRRDPSKPLEPHSAHFIWEAVEMSDKIRGEFRGYRLQYWKSSEGRHKMQEVDVAVTPQPPERHPVVRATLLDLPANTALRAQVAVRNTHYTGVPSMTIDFFTPEGTPTAVRSLAIMEVEETYVLLQWLPPEEPNGRLVGFDFGYQPVEGNQVGEVRDLRPRITDPSKLSAKITGLQPDSSYRFVVWARTKAGRGKMAAIDVQTKRETRGSSFYTHSSASSVHATVTSWLRHWTVLVTSLCASLLAYRTMMRDLVFL